MSQREHAPVKIRTALSRVERRFAWSFLGFVLAAIFGSITVYIEFYRDLRPDLRFEIISNTSVLDVREELGNLEIIYDGIDIKKSEQSLRVILLQVVNDGLSDILKGHYDEAAPLGFTIEHGSLLRTELISATSSYLQTSLSVRSDSATQATFSPVILESAEGFTLKILLLHPESLTPSLTPIGKVAGVRTLRLVERGDLAARPSFLYRTYSGSLFVQVIRSLSYPIAFIAMMILFLVLPTVGLTSVSTRVTKARRRRTVSKFKAQAAGLTDEDSCMFDKYVAHGLARLVEMRERISDADKLQAFMSEAQRLGDAMESLRLSKDRERIIFSVDDDEAYPIPSEHFFRNQSARMFPGHVVFLAGELVRDGFVEKKESGYTVDARRQGILGDFIDFVSR